MNLKAVLAVAVALLAGLYATPVVADEPQREENTKGWHAPHGGFFNSPIGGPESQRAIERRVLAMIRHAKPDSYIRIALFSFDRRNMATALINAHEKRNVNVQLLLNDHQMTAAMRRLRSAFGVDRSEKTFFRRCKKGCRSQGEFLHSKIYMFSRTGKSKHVIATGSANLTTNAMINQWNDLLIRPDNEPLYDAFKKVFNEMKKDKKATPLYKVIDVEPRYQVQALPFPKPSADRDPVMRVLNKISCKGAKGGTGIDGRTMLRVSMHRWAGNRGVYLARKVVRLHGQGCNVAVMHGSADPGVRRAITRNTKRGRVPIRANGFDENGDGQIDRYSHHKYFLISGHFGDDRSEERLYTGSSNWARRGATGDEIIFLARGKGYVNQWKRNFDHIWRHGSRPITYGREGARTGTEPRIGGESWEND